MEAKEELINIKDLLAILRKRLLLILSITLLTAILAGAYSYFYKTPSYTAVSEILVNKEEMNKGQLTPEQIQANIQLIGTYQALIKNPRVIDQVAQKLNMTENKKLLETKITPEWVKDSQLITITAKDTDPKTAIAIANTVTTVFKSEASTIMKSDIVQIVLEAKEAVPVVEKKSQNVVIGTILGLVLGCVLAFLLDYFNRFIRNERDVERELGVPVLAKVSGMAGKKDDFRRLRANIQLVGMDQELKSLVITSPENGPGKTATAANLAVSMARHGLKTIYVQADGENKSVAEIFHVKSEQGLLTYLQGQAPLSALIQESEIANFTVSILPFGTPGTEVGQGISSNKMTDLLQELKGMFDFIIIEAPAIYTAADSVVLARKADGCLLVLEAGKTNIEAAVEVKKVLTHAKAHLLGVVLNQQ